jgi:hypothetical protein
MRRIFLTLTLFSILAILPVSIFTQVSDDWDNDGVKNSEDACPNDKGTKANKGCPEKTAKPTPTSNPNSQTTANKCVSGDCVNGKGKMVYSNGNIYEGDFVSGKPEGHGTTNFANGSIYTGQFSNGRTDGQGVFKMKDGAIYSGQFSQGLYHGKGKYNFPDGGIYDGNWVNGIREGQGKMTFADGGIYDGSWVNGKREGQGTYTTKDGSYYSGEWKNNKANGIGKDYSKATNIRREGTYKDGNFIPATPTVTSTVATLSSSDSEETRVNGLKEYYKQALQKKGIFVEREGTAVNTTYKDYVPPIVADLKKGYMYHFLAISSGKLLVWLTDDPSGHFASGYSGNNSVLKRLGLSSYFFSVAYDGQMSSRSFSFQPTRQKVYWVLFRGEMISKDAKGELSMATPEPPDDDVAEKLEQRDAQLGKEIDNLKVKLEQQKAALKEYQTALANIKKHADAFTSAKQKLKTDSGNAKNYIIQMKNELQAVVDIAAGYLAKFENKLQKTGSAQLDETVDQLKNDMALMRKQMEQNKASIIQLEALIKKQ